MYLEHFGLSEAPFRITPHTEFFFAGANRGATLEALLYAVTHDEGIVKVSGEVGSGKTMLCRVLMERLPAQVVIVYLANPSLSRQDIVFAIADELELATPDHGRASAVVRLLQNRLIDLHAEGRQVVVLIDEAHAMPLETLEEVRLLSNLETSQHKLLQLVLFGQPELDAVLARADMRQLRERITHNFSLDPLGRDDIAKYLDFRMRTAGYRGPDVFSPNAVKLIADASQGLTRRVNILAEKSLLAAYAEGIHQITPKQVDAAIRDAQYEQPLRGWRRWLPIAAGMFLVVGMAGLVAWLKQEGKPVAAVPPPVPPQAEAMPAATAATSLPASLPAPSISPATPAQTESFAKPVAATIPSVDESPALSREAPASVSGQLNSAAQQRLEETRQWIAATAGNRWFIQLLATGGDQINEAQQYLAKADTLLQPEHAGLYIAESGKGQRLGVVYGDFPSRQAANRAAERLPAELRTNKPFPRQVLWLK
jgi:type II secretory pathway predicted ATPase ExeA